MGRSADDQLNQRALLRVKLYRRWATVVMAPKVSFTLFNHVTEVFFFFT